MTSSTLQVIGHGPVVLVTQLAAHHVGDNRCDTTKLRMSKGILESLVGEKLALAVGNAFRDNDGNIAVFFHLGLDLGQELRLVEGYFREQDDDWQVAVFRAGHTAGCRDPAGMAAHYLEYEYLGGSGTHGGDVKTGLAGGNGDVLGHRAEARAVIGDRQVVVHGFGDMNRLDRVTGCLGELRYLQAGIGRVTTAVVEEVTDVVCCEDLDEAVILTLVGLQALHLVAAGAEGAGWCLAQCGDGARRFLAGIDQVFFQGTDDSVAAGKDLANLVLVFARRLDNAAGGCIDYSGHTAGLCVERIFLLYCLCHRLLSVKLTGCLG